NERASERQCRSMHFPHVAGAPEATDPFPPALPAAAPADASAARTAPAHPPSRPASPDRPREPPHCPAPPEALSKTLHRPWENPQPKRKSPPHGGAETVNGGCSGPTRCPTVAETLFKINCLLTRRASREL